jgi:hypothetical protein
MRYDELPRNAIFRFENDRDLYEKVSETHYRRGVHQINWVCQPITNRPEPVEPLLCENCDETITCPVQSGPRTYCSEECLRESDELRSLAREEAKHQYELYGDDLDSWYR